MTESDWPGPRGRERSMSLAQFEIFQQTQAKLKAEREAKDAEYKAALKAAQDAADEIARLREALQGLLDEQNGPPLIGHAASWQAAVDAARAALEGRTDG